MKNILKYLFLFTILSCKSQVTSVLPLGSIERPNGAYLKDLNNELDYYVGKWEGTFKNRKYTFEFVKFTQRLRSYDGTTNGKYYYKDELKAKFKVVDLLTNQVLFDNLNVTDYDDYLILGLAKKNGMFNFRYRDKPENCNLLAEFDLRRINGQPNQLTYCYFTLRSYRDYECITYQSIHDIPIFLPKVNLTLTKQ